ncbi:MAG: transaldolase [Candidatus Marinimicrobia bacterium]|nr:transaldolase [Candidatus Neomarinimicrobiota bacterium]MCF7828665.1 transaldolase [Candidatus Neomarinimicrobiota bacterium]MCF7880406.1 transaldolase [Candidatus Neomarinimicrobiota bacterium]
MNRLTELINYGQSYWLDNLTRGKIKSGELKNRVEEQGLRGITSNPSIFQKAITQSDDYDDQIRELTEAGKSVDEVYEAVVVKDVQDACDELRGLYDETDGADGYVSLEVSPYLAHDTEGTANEARRLFKKVDRPNCFIKIPGTPAGVPAIEEALYEGINVNVTLLFSIQSYEDVAYAYIRAMERRAAEGLPLKSVASVASFFLSRMDVLVDELLEHRIYGTDNTEEKKLAKELMGESAIANAKLAYQSYKWIFGSARWKLLEEKGARVQRPLWASTSTKNPEYSDVRYVDSLIGQNTVNTLPDKTIDAFADHGTLKENTVEEGIEESEETLMNMYELDIDLDYVTQRLLDEGIQKFIKPFDNLMETLEQKMKEVG